MERLLQGLRAAAEDTRLRVLALCSETELSVSELTQILGQSQPRVSRHLKLMVEAGLLERFREGAWAFYRVAETGANAALANSADVAFVEAAVGQGLFSAIPGSAFGLPGSLRLSFGATRLEDIERLDGHLTALAR